MIANTDDPLAIPDFLKRAPQPVKRLTPMRERKLVLPPRALVPVLRAVRDGKDTWPQIKSRLGKRYEDKELRAALKCLVSSGEVQQKGRRYMKKFA